MLVPPVLIAVLIVVFHVISSVKILAEYQRGVIGAQRPGNPLALAIWASMASGTLSFTLSRVGVGGAT